MFRTGTAIGVKQTATTFTDQRKRVNTCHYQVRAIDGAGRERALARGDRLFTALSQAPA